MGPTIGLLTDFGTLDTYVGVMKGVIAGISPEAKVIDVTHAVPPGDVRNGAFQLWKAVRYFPEESIFVIVVDPGVGTERRAIAVAWRGRKLVAPDNGVLSYALAGSAPEAGYELQDPSYRLPRVSSTFHGRDIFAPAGAHLARGVALSALGPAAGDLKTLRPPILRQVSEGIEGEIIHIDGFGNLITSVGHLHDQQGSYQLDPWLSGVEPLALPANGIMLALVGGVQLALHGTFGDVPEGELVAYVGSEGLLEVAVNRGRADERLGAQPGDPVRLIRGEG